MRKVSPAMQAQLKTLIESMGNELVGCEMLLQGKQTLFRLYIDKPGGVSVDDCAQVSRQVSAMLDVEGLIQGHYILEVSSPGIDRPLFELAQFHQFVGSQIKIKLRAPINQRRQYKGILRRVEGENIYVLLEDLGQEVELPYSAIERANLIGTVHL